MLNEQFRVYNVTVFSVDGSRNTKRERTKDEAVGAVKHWLPSWTTKAIAVINTNNWCAKWWEKDKKGNVTTKVYMSELPQPTPRNGGTPSKG